MGHYVVPSARMSVRQKAWRAVKDVAVEATAALARELEKYRLFTEQPSVGSLSLVAVVMRANGPAGYIEFGLLGAVYPGPYFHFYLAEEGDWSPISQYYSADNVEQLRDRMEWFLDPEWVEEKARQIAEETRKLRSVKDWMPPRPI